MCLLFFSIAVSFGCKKKSPSEHNGCPGFSLSLIPPYDSPVWHPSGDIIGFNHTPLKEIRYEYGYGCPSQATYVYQTDAAGFWLIDSDGKNQRRLLDFKLQNPAWSPDGRWIAFVKNAQIYKMPFDGEKFDTSKMVQLTNQGRNFFPAWSPDGGKIAFDSNEESLKGLHFVWMMDRDGNNKKRLYYTPEVGEIRMPTWLSGSKLAFLRYDSQFGRKICSGDTLGGNLIELTKSLLFIKNYPRSSVSLSKIAVIASNKLGGAQLYHFNYDGNNLKQLTSEGAFDFSWSPTGRLAYVSFNGARIDEKQGCLWLMDTDGNNKKQLTKNNINITQ